MPPSDSAAPAADFSFVEVDDAGEQISGATPIFADLVQPLTSISGTLSGDADLFQIYISGDRPFSATTLSPATLLGLPIDNALGIPNPLLEDPQLFLFDAAGNGIYGNDDLFGSAQATLPSMIAPLDAGIYYLAISGFDYDPISAGGEIFPDDSLDGVLLPTGPGRESPLIGFAGDGSAGGNYTIALTGAQTIQPGAAVSPLPELVDLTGFDGNVTVNAIQQLAREAFFDNVLAFYKTDAQGQVAGLLPGDPGYEAAAAANLIDGIRLTVGNNQTIDASLNLQGGAYYAPALLIDGSLQNLATVGDAALGQARIQRSGNTWQFEDAGDCDFNDLIVTLTPEITGMG
ncbi:DVUA0089 family protein [Nodosilinea nodulosa]|uniref:DVUA0089 family protein n=1 Tax=Nodosilinea nodulosa TaxID=416001 RepID=UPI0003785155|nr:DVUA0089 family protein [Nodosilinea nodulosa]